MASPIRVILADDNEIFAKIVCSQFCGHPQISLCSVATTAHELFQQTEEHLPDLVLIVLQMNKGTGLELCTQLHERHPYLPLIAFTTKLNENDMALLEKAGVKGCLQKYCYPHEMEEAIKAVHQGGKYHCAETSSLLLEANKSRQIKMMFDERDLGILKLMCEEMKTPEIAKLFFLSSHTIESNRRKLLRKCKVKSSVGLAVYVYKNGLHKFWMFLLPLLYTVLGEDVVGMCEVV